MIKTISLLRRYGVRHSSRSILKMEETAKEIFKAALDAVTPRELITKRQFISLKKDLNKEFLEIKNNNSTYKLDVTDKNIHVVGAGKGVLAIAVELEGVLGSRLKSGILSVPENSHTLSSSKIKVLQGAAFNLPDHASMQAAIEIKNKVYSLTHSDIIICLITGGGSALLSLAIEPITLEEKSSLIKNLSRAGASINELNVVRIAISQVKGGKLARSGRNAYQIISLIVSDIIGDPLELIASGPTIPYIKSEITPRKVLEKYNLMDSLPTSIAQVIQKNEDNQDISSDIKNSQVFLIGSNRIAIEAAMNKAKSLNLYPIFLSAEVQGNVDDISKAFYDLARALKAPSSLSREEFKRTLEILHAQPAFEKEFLEAPRGGLLCIVSGGETTVKVTGDGNGGRNQELALRFTKLCHDAQMSLLNNILLLSCGTDGIDGNCDAAGAIGGLKILHNLPDSEDISSIMEDFILRNDSYNFYKNFLSKYASGYHIITGHTGTNVMDIQLLIVPKQD